MSDGLTDDELDAMEARAEAATEGPWVSGDYTVLAEEAIVAHRGKLVWGESVPLFEAVPGSGVNQQTAFQNTKFIEHAREDVPRLVDEVRRLRKALVEIVFTDGRGASVARKAIGWSEEDVRRMYLEAMRGGNDK